MSVAVSGSPPELCPGLVWLHVHDAIANVEECINHLKNVHDAEGQVTAQVWGRPLSGGRVAVVFFNRGEATRNVSATFEEMGIAGGMETATVTVTDVWSGDVVSGVSSPVVAPAVEAHGVAFLVLAPE